MAIIDHTDMLIHSSCHPAGGARRMNDPCPSISSQSRAQRASGMLFFGNKRWRVDASPVMVGRSIGETSADRSRGGEALSGCQGNETSAANEEEFRGCFRNDGGAVCLCRVRGGLHCIEPAQLVSRSGGEFSKRAGDKIARSVRAPRLPTRSRCIYLWPSTARGVSIYARCGQVSLS